MNNQQIPRVEERNSRLVRLENKTDETMKTVKELLKEIYPAIKREYQVIFNTEILEVLLCLSNQGYFSEAEELTMFINYTIDISLHRFIVNNISKASLEQLNRDIKAELARLKSTQQTN